MSLIEHSSELCHDEESEMSLFILPDVSKMSFLNYLFLTLLGSGENSQRFK